MTPVTKQLGRSNSDETRERTQAAKIAQNRKYGGGGQGGGPGSLAQYADSLLADSLRTEGLLT